MVLNFEVGIVVGLLSHQPNEIFFSARPDSLPPPPPNFIIRRRVQPVIYIVIRLLIIFRCGTNYIRMVLNSMSLVLLFG